MEALARSMNYQLKKLDLISRWEEVTGLEFEAPAYEVVLSTGMANGPTGNDLVHRICQDAGRRLLVNVCCEKYKEYDPLLCYQVYESLNKYLTNLILDEVGWKTRNRGNLSGQNDLYALFNSIMMESPGIKAMDLYAIALDDYSKAITVTGQ